LARGEQFKEDFTQINGDALVPVLEVDGLRLTQSLAIIEYLDDTHPEPALLPKDPAGRARVRALAQSVACEIHPLNNLRVLKYLTNTLQLTEDQKNTWYRHWVRLGLEAFENQLHHSATGRFCHGNAPSLADCTLVPQIFNGKRFDVDFSGLDKTMAIFNACMEWPAFQQAQPSACPDFEA
jgi:maleylacetoacetate isomerase/maleylpyruvate isomerase